MTRLSWSRVDSLLLRLLLLLQKDLHLLLDVSQVLQQIFLPDLLLLLLSLPAGQNWALLTLLLLLLLTLLLLLLHFQQLQSFQLLLRQLLQEQSRLLDLMFLLHWESVWVLVPRWISAASPLSCSAPPSPSPHPSGTELFRPGPWDQNKTVIQRSKVFKCYNKTFWNLSQQTVSLQFYLLLLCLQFQHHLLKLHLLLLQDLVQALQLLQTQMSQCVAAVLEKWTNKILHIAGNAVTGRTERERGAGNEAAVGKKNPPKPDHSVLWIQEDFFFSQNLSFLFVLHQEKSWKWN